MNWLNIDSKMIRISYTCHIFVPVNVILLHIKLVLGFFLGQKVING
jgi:hypothetical protein